MSGHHRSRVATRGPEPEEAGAAVVVVHGRGGSPEGMLALASEVDIEELAWLAPQADGGTWYPRRFVAPPDENEPWLSSALAWLDAIVEDLGGRGVPPESVSFVGFSQGACLSAEFVARNPRRYGALAALSGGLMGPSDDDLEARLVRGGEGGGEPLAGTPVFFGCSDVDPHIPEERVHESGRVLDLLGADVTVRIYPGMGHTVNDDEIAVVRSMLQRTVG